MPPLSLLLPLLAAALATPALALDPQDRHAKVPRLFHLDDYDACLSRPAGLYCLGTFRLEQHGEGEGLFSILKRDFSSEHHFDRWMIHRGLCVSKRCVRVPEIGDASSVRGQLACCAQHPGNETGARSQGPYCASARAIGPGTMSTVRGQLARCSPAHAHQLSNVTSAHVQSPHCAAAHTEGVRSRFDRCVAAWAARRGLSTRLATLHYCTTGTPQKLLTAGQLAFLVVCGLVLLPNVVVNIYDVMRNSEKKLSGWASAWSLAQNVRALGAPPARVDLAPLQGLKSVFLICIMLGHVMFAYHMTYTHNPEFVEQAYLYPVAMLARNSTMIVQAYVVLASFLLALNLLELAASHKAHLTLKKWPHAMFIRLIRIVPVNTLVVWWAMTWWERSSDGPMWTPLVREEAARCRANWWAQLLFLNNFVRPYDRCLIQTWFLAVDVQLYAVAAALALLLVPRPHVALRLLPALFLLSVLFNFFLAYAFDLKSMLYMLRPEPLRTQFVGEPSFPWLYAAPWGSLPSSLAGVMVAFTYHHAQQTGFEPQKHKWVAAVQLLVLPTLVCWVLGGWWAPGPGSSLARAAYSALSVPVFVVGLAVGMFAVFHDTRCFLHRLLSLQVLQVLGRMSLTLFMLHWSVTLSFFAARPHAVYVSLLEVASTWVLVMVLTFLLALPMYLLVEVPIYRFFKFFLLKAVMRENPNT